MVKVFLKITFLSYIYHQKRILRVKKVKRKAKTVFKIVIINFISQLLSLAPLIVSLIGHDLILIKVNMLNLIANLKKFKLILLSNLDTEKLRLNDKF